MVQEEGCNTAQGGEQPVSVTLCEARSAQKQGAHLDMMCAYKERRKSSNSSLQQPTLFLDVRALILRKRPSCPDG